MIMERKRMRNESGRGEDRIGLGLVWFGSIWLQVMIVK